jgi:hypothetical protein
MAGTFRVTFEMKKFFFDRKVVQNAVDKQQRRAISRSLAFVRTRARSLLRRRKSVAAPGKPPSVHTSGVGLKTILFAYDMRTKGGIVGPVKLNKVSMTSTGPVPIPGVMELGGSLRIQETQSNTDGRWYRRNLRSKMRPGQKKRTRTVKYPPRPFMGPALEMESEAGNILSPWSNVVGS